MNTTKSSWQGIHSKLNISRKKSELPKWCGILFNEIWWHNKNDVCEEYSKTFLRYLENGGKVRNEIIQIHYYVKSVFHWKLITKTKKEREENIAK